MPTIPNRCPECGTQLDPELIRCTNCLAFVHDTNPWQREHKLIAFPLAVVVTTILAVVIRQGLVPGMDEILGNGISLTIIGIGIYALLVITIKNRITSRQIKAFRIIRRLLAPGNGLNRDILGEARDAITLQGLAPFNTLLAYNRLQWVVEAAAVDVSERELLLRSMREHSETDWESLEGTFSFVQYLVWLLPSLGFLGTVWGMTTALNGFSNTVNQTAGDLSFQNSLSETAQGLGVAFHTTLVGLALVIPVLLAATASRRRVQHLLEQLDRFFIRYCSIPLGSEGLGTGVAKEALEGSDNWGTGIEKKEPELPISQFTEVTEVDSDIAENPKENQEDISLDRAIVGAEETPPKSVELAIDEEIAFGTMPNHGVERQNTSDLGDVDDDTQPGDDAERK